MNKNFTQNFHKKIIFTLALTFMVFSLCACSGKPKNFTVEELTVTLTNDFKVSKSDGFDIYLTSDDVIFSAVRESSSDLDSAGYEIFSLNDYALEIAELNNVQKSKIVPRNDYYYFTNNKTVSGAKYTYVHCMFYSKGNYWVCEFVCKAKNYDRFKDDIFDWADSIVIN